MKIRNGFVSNSSSSSFIIYKGAIGEEAFNNLVEVCRKAEEKEREETSWSPSWGDSGETYGVENDYIYVETHRAPESVRKLAWSFSKKAYHYEG